MSRYNGLETGPNKKIVSTYTHVTVIGCKVNK